MPINRGHPIRVLPFFGYRSSKRLCISARALRAGQNDFSIGGRWRALCTMLAQFASHEIAGLYVSLRLNSPNGASREFSAASDKEGFVHFDVELDDWQLPAGARWERATFTWSYDGVDSCAEAHLLAPDAAANLGVISDIDDTIIETGITGNVRALMRNWKRVLMQMPEERIAVPGVVGFYNALGGNSALDEGSADLESSPGEPTDRPFFYVSSSPWNLYSYLVAYKKSRKLPLGPIAMRDWGLNSETFGSSSHGTHKHNAIGHILDLYPEIQFVLIGDDTQGDLIAFGQIVKDYPGRIATVFVRTIDGALSEVELTAKSMIENANVPLWRGPDFAAAKAFLFETGLASHHDATQVVEGIEENE